MEQLGIRFRPASLGNEAWLNQLALLGDIVKHLETKNVLYELDVTKSTLSEALRETNDKRWAAEWTHIVKAMLAQRYDEVSIELLRKLCDFDLTTTTLVVGEPRGFTVEEENQVMRAELAQMGPQGQAVIDRVRSKSKAKRR